jgi:sugar phosphate isomerase/epimerase
MARPENSVQLYSVREHLDRDFDSTLNRLAEIGFRSVEPFSLPDNLGKLKQALLNAGLKAPTAHGSVLEQPEAAISAALELGTTLLIDPYQPEEIFQSEAKVEMLAEKLSAAAAMGKMHGIKIGYHNHDHELTNTVRGEPAHCLHSHQWFLKMLYLRLTLFWCQVAKVDPLEVLKKLEGRVVALHAKDAPLGGHVDDQVVLGSGSVDLLACINHLPDAQVVVEFDTYSGDLFAALDSSLQYLRANGVQ